MNKKLLPCPWCGNTPQVCHGTTNRRKGNTHYVSCVNWDCKVKPSTGREWTIEEAVKAWNTREEKKTNVL
jgi:hypothetical protein